MSTPDTVGEVKSSFSPAASRSIAGCGVSHIGEVAHIVTEGLKMSRTDLLPSKFQIDPEHEIDALCRHTVKNIGFPRMILKHSRIHEEQQEGCEREK